MRECVWVFLGSGLGGVIRYELGKLVNSWHGHCFPLGTFVVNIVACLFLGFVIGLSGQKNLLSQSERLFLTVGFCGGFSTFSTFSSETITLFQQGHQVISAIYVVASIAVSVIAVVGGNYLAERI